MDKPTEPSHPTDLSWMKKYDVIIYDCWYETMRVVSKAHYKALIRDKLSRYGDYFSPYKPLTEQSQGDLDRLCWDYRPVLMPVNQQLEPLILYYGFWEYKYKVVTHTGEGDEKRYASRKFRTIDFNKLSAEDQEKQQKGQIKYVVCHRFNGGNHGQDFESYNEYRYRGKARSPAKPLDTET